MLRVAWLGVLVLVLGGCGSTDAKPPSAPVSPPAPRPAPVEPEPVETPPDAAPEPEPPPAAEPEPNPDPEPRKVIYRVSPQGLIIEVEGLRLTPKATARKMPNGGYAIDMEVVAEAMDDRSHTLLSPTLGPLAIAVKVFDKKGNLKAEYADEREGAEQQFVMPGGPLTFERSWPSGSVKGPLWWGQRVRLQAGLWGLGTDGDSGRPLRKLFVVDMTAKANPKPTITPPTLD